VFGNEWRMQLTSVYRLNSFKNIGPDSNTVSINQWRSSVGFEYEGLKFENGGPLSLSVEGSVSIFSKSRYKQIFDEEKNMLYVLESTIILPLSEKIGFFINGTYSKGLSPSYVTGIVLREAKPKN
jgi:hypothetical protein